MAHLHCTGQGQGLEMMGSYITLFIVHNTQGQRRGQETIVFYCTRPSPCPSFGPVQCV